MSNNTRTSFIGRYRQRQQCRTVALEPLANRLCMSAQPPLTSLPAIGFRWNNSEMLDNSA